MYFVISHFTKNLGTTDYLLEYFRGKKISYLFLRHPFQSEQDLANSELLYFDGERELIVKKYKKCHNFFVEMMRNILLSFYISIRYFTKYERVIGFGGFNVFPILWTRLFGKFTYFWGVDYSRKRFQEKILNVIYRFLETLGCVFATKVVHLSKRQEEARLKNHYLNKGKSIIIPSGFQYVDFKVDGFQKLDLGFFYLGSITHQHGIVDFVKYFYIKHSSNVPLYIVGGGELEEQLIEIIENNNLNQKVFFLGRKNKNEILSFLERSTHKLWGIAPYSDAVNDHVYYGDSLKIREYLGYNLPFLVSSIAYISDDLQKFGIIYNNFEDVNLQELENFSFDIDEKNKVLERYTWENLFNKEF